MDPLVKLLRELRKRRNELSEELAGGAAKDWAHYRHYVGIITTLATTEEQIRSVISRSEEDIEDNVDISAQ